MTGTSLPRLSGSAPEPQAGCIRLHGGRAGHAAQPEALSKWGQGEGICRTDRRRSRQNRGELQRRIPSTRHRKARQSIYSDLVKSIAELTEARKFSRDDRLRSGTSRPEAARLKTPTLSRSWTLISLLLSIVMLMVIGDHYRSSGIGMKETVNQKRKAVARFKELELTLAPKMQSTSIRHSLLSARYPVNGAWPAAMRIDMLAAYLDFRSVRELVLALSRGEAPPPTSHRGTGPSREAIWARAVVDEYVAPGRTVAQNRSKSDLAALA
jgi:hypothetical protein